MTNSKPSHIEIDTVIDPELLKDNFTKAEEQEIRVDFNPQELLEMKDNYFQLSSQLQRRQEAESSAKMAINSGLDVSETLTEIARDIRGVDFGEGDTKSLKTRSSALLQTINHGYELRKEKLFGIDYQSCGRMAWYDQNGIFVYDRPLTQHERQTNIHQLKSTGTNG